MSSQLENLCEKRGIKVEFISNKFIDSDSEFKNSTPVIKVHKIFKQCSMRVATAVLEIYTGEGYISECIEIIESYLKEKFGPIGVKIQPPKAIITKPVDKQMDTEYKGKKESYSESKDIHSNTNETHLSTKEIYGGKEELYFEAEISSIDVTNMRGQKKKLINNEALTATDQDVLELDVVVRPPIT